MTQTKKFHAQVKCKQTATGAPNGNSIINVVNVVVVIVVVVATRCRLCLFGFVITLASDVCLNERS